MDRFPGRFIALWFAEGSIRVRAGSPRNREPILRKVPPGGAPCPLPWIVRFDSISPRLTAMREAEVEIPENVSASHLIYAGDAASLLAHEDAVLLRCADRWIAELVVRVPGQVGLHLSVPESCNSVVSPLLFIGSLFYTCPILF